MKKVLVVDDERDIREYLRRILEINGFDVVEADSGETALYALACHPDTSLMILDWMMPGMSGIDVLQQLRDQFDPVPVLMLSARTEQSDVIKALNYGAIDYVLKPLQKDHFLFKVNSLIERNRKSVRKRASRRKNVNFNSTADVVITAISSKQVVIDTGFRIPEGSVFVMRSSGLGLSADLPADSRYSCRVTGCEAHDHKFRVTAEFINLSPKTAQKIRSACEQEEFSSPSEEIRKL